MKNGTQHPDRSATYVKLIKYPERTRVYFARESKDAGGKGAFVARSFDYGQQRTLASAQDAAFSTFVTHW